LVPKTLNTYVPIGVNAVVVTLSVETMLAPVVTAGLLPKTAFAPVGRGVSGETPSVTVQGLLLPPTVTVTFPYAPVAPWATLALIGAATLVDCGFESVKVAVAMPVEAPVAMTE
jgi:hypothetical protein